MLAVSAWFDLITWASGHREVLFSFQISGIEPSGR